MLAVLATPAGADDTKQFQAPSGNIHCVMYGDDPVEGRAMVRCDMLELTQSVTKPPPDGDPGFDTSFSAATDDVKGGRTCHGDTIILPTMDMLVYGDLLTVGGITSVSEKTGPTCTNPAGAGFALTRTRQTVF